MGSAHAVKQQEISYRGSMQSGLAAESRQVDLPMDCVAGIDETTAGPVSPNGYYLYCGHVSQPLIWYQ